MRDLNGDGFNIGATKWTTLGGTQKGSSPTQDEIDLSRKNAMKMFWNFYSVTTEAGTVTLDTLDGHPFEPKYRVCREFSSWIKGIDRLLVSAGFQRMYDGSIDDEDNFVGYGALSLAVASRVVSGAPTIRFNFKSWTASDDTTQRKGEYNDSFAGFPLIADVISSAPATITISGLTATIDGDDPGWTSTNSITYSDIDFYTY